MSSCALSPLPSQPIASTTSTLTNTSQTVATGPIEALVSRVIDGDEIEIYVAGKTFTVRYLGVTSPADDEPFWAEATVANGRLVEGKKVRLEKDVSDVDQDGRILRYVYVGEEFVNANMINLGYAKASISPPDMRFQDMFERLQREAIAARKGMWESQTPTRTLPPPTFETPPPRS